MVVLSSYSLDDCQGALLSIFEFSGNALSFQSERTSLKWTLLLFFRNPDVKKLFFSVIRTRDEDLNE